MVLFILTGGCAIVIGLSLLITGGMFVIGVSLFALANGCVGWNCAVNLVNNSVISTFSGSGGLTGCLSLTP